MGFYTGKFYDNSTDMSTIKEFRQRLYDSVNDKAASFENDDQRKAYHLGVENTLSVLKQLLDQGVRRDNITFYYPKAETSEEMTKDEIAEWLETLPF